MTNVNLLTIEINSFVFLGGEYEGGQAIKPSST